MKWCSKSILIREMLIKAVMSHCYVSSVMGLVKKTEHTESAGQGQGVERLRSCPQLGGP